MKPVLGKNLREKRVVSSSGLEIGQVADATFEGDRIIDIVIRPEARTKEVTENVGRDGMLKVPDGPGIGVTPVEAAIKENRMPGEPWWD